MPPTHTPAPKRSVARKNLMGTTLPPGAQVLVDSLVGTFIGANRSEVLRFIVVSWLTEHLPAVKDIRRRPQAPALEMEIR